MLSSFFMSANNNNFLVLDMNEMLQFGWNVYYSFAKKVNIITLYYDYLV